MPGASRARALVLVRAVGAPGGGCGGTRRRRGRGAAGRRPAGRGDSARGGGAGAAGDREPTAAAAGPACLATGSTSLREPSGGRGRRAARRWGAVAQLCPRTARGCAARPPRLSHGRVCGQMAPPAGMRPSRLRRWKGWRQSKVASVQRPLGWRGPATPSQRGLESPVAAAPPESPRGRERVLRHE